MKPQFIDVWAWIRIFHHQALRNGDPIRSRLDPLFDEAWEYFDRNPDLASNLLKQGRALAQQINEQEWVLFFDHWLCEVLAWYKHDTMKALDLAVRNVIRANQPQFRNWSFLPRIHYDLISIYGMTDPLSYGEYIRDTLQLLETELNFDSDVWRRIPAEHTSLLTIEEKPEQALQMAHESLLRSEGDDFRLAGAYSMLCPIEYCLNHIDAMIQLGQTGEIHARRATNRKYDLIELQIWQAVGYLKLGDQENAHRHYQTALSTIHSLGEAFQLFRVPVLAVYEEQLGNFDKAVGIRRDCVTQAMESGNFFAEYLARLEVCRLLKIMGLLTEDEITVTRAALNHLKTPSCYPPRLESIIAGDTSPIL